MLIRQVKSMLDTSPANASNHRFFRQFTERKSPEQIERFALQWYTAARSHKIAFPHLVAITTEDTIRFGLIEILRDEYGNGDPQKIHARLLEKFLKSGVGLSPETVANIQPVPEIAAFANTTLETWRDGNAVIAFGYHYALEYIAQDIHKVFFLGLKDCGFSPETLEYFAYHSTAEEEHTRVTEKGFLHYANDRQNHNQLMEGVRSGAISLLRMWDGFHRHVFN